MSSFFKLKTAHYSIKKLFIVSIIMFRSIKKSVSVWTLAHKLDILHCGPFVLVNHRTQSLCSPRQILHFISGQVVNIMILFLRDIISKIYFCQWISRKRLKILHLSTFQKIFGIQIWLISHITIELVIFINLIIEKNLSWLLKVEISLVITLIFLFKE